MKSQFTFWQNSVVYILQSISICIFRLLFSQGSKHKLVYDGMWHFDIPKTRDIDGGKVEVIARNSCGEAYASTTLTVTPRQDDYRAVLRHNVKRK